MTRESEARAPETVPAGEADELLTLDEAVQFLSTSKPTLYRWLAQGELKGRKVGKQWRFRRADLVAYLNRDPLTAATAPEAAVETELAFFADELGKLNAAIPDEGELAAGETNLTLLAKRICALAVASRASDIHLEPVRQSDDAYYWLRFRMDGLLHEIRRFPMSLYEPLNLSFKQLACLDLAERRMPQDGRFRTAYGGQDYVFYVADLPTATGEALTFRILLKEAMLLTLEQIGIPTEHTLRSWLHEPNGLVLFVGLHGSGKTTTLYSSLREIAAPDRRSFMVVEQYEYAIPMTTVVPVNERAGLSHAAALRAVGRHDPDIVLTDDLPDVETARRAHEMALTGHLVLAQMEAADSADAVLRLLGMGVEPFAVNMALMGVVAQRLVRRICTNCKEPYKVESSHPLFAQAQPLAAAGGYEMPDDVTLYRGRGCEQCRQTGYRRRMALYEVMPWSPALAEALLHKASAQELTDIAVANGMRTLFAHGVAAAVAGETTLEEVFRVAMTVLTAPELLKAGL